MCRDASPEDVWNAHWARILDDPIGRGPALVGMAGVFLDRNLVVLRQLNVRRLLLPGNGCSLLPHALVHRGFDVTVVDISSVANQAVASVEPTPELISQFLPGYRKQRDRFIGHVLVPDPEASLRRVAREAAPGGRLTVITADMLEWDPEEPFDCIYDDRLAMVLPAESWARLARKYRRLLRADGLCIVETLNLGCGMQQDTADMRTNFEAAFASAGFGDFGWLPPGASDGPRVRFIHGSG